MAWGPHCSQGCSVVLADGIAVDPFIFRVMTDRPWEAWREQAGPPSALSIDRLGHPAPHDVPTPQLSFFRRSAEAWGKHSSQMHRCSSGRRRTSGRKRVSERKQHRTPSAVANLFDKKELFEMSAAGALRVPSHITERNQPPAPRPTAALLSRPHFLSSNQTLTDKYPTPITPASGVHRDCIRRCQRPAVIGSRVCF